MHITKGDEKWLAGMVEKRPETLLVLLALVLHGIKHGTVTAEDGHHVPVSHPNCRGAAMRYMRRFGFKKGEIIQGTTPAAKGHYLHVWVLDDFTAASCLVQHVKRAVQPGAGKVQEHEQMGLL